jgi:3-isopropylmalate/(R)-2-methylmalate dehydratase small subunit
VIAPSFNPIFRGNCVRNGIVPVELSADEIAAMAADAPAFVTIDLPVQSVRTVSGTAYGFAIEAEAKDMLLHGLDAIDLTLRRHDEIAAFRAADSLNRPWAYLKNGH